MKNRHSKKIIGKLALLTLFSGFTISGVVFACDNQGASDSVGACSTASQCSNFNSQSTCTTAVTVAAFPTGCKADPLNNCDKPSLVCTTPITCQWVNNACTVVGGSAGTGTTANALCPTTVDCGG
jgi:hypothetical protein